MISAVTLINAQGITKDGNKIPRVPDWAKKAVWYQIFPERFSNGDTSNDPGPEDMQGAWPYRITEGWQISPWTSDWYKLQPWEQANGHGFYWNSGVRRYGGDIQGIINKLDYLKNLGITAIYLNPVFESPSLHKYDTRMYHHIDNNFGPNPKLDEKIWSEEDPGNPETWKWTTADSLFLEFISKAHQEGIKVIIDGVFNHVGTSFWAFQDVIKNQKNSRYKNWFRIDSFDDPATHIDEFKYEGWNGVKDLPEIKKDPETGLVKDFAAHIHAIIKRWMDPDGDGDPSDGIDGWRLDVAEKINLNFWRIFRQWVKEINPQAYITGEIWWEDWPKNQIFNAAPWLQGDAFDAVMNYRFARDVKSFIIDIKDQITPEAFADSIMSMEKDYPKDNLYVLQNLIDSHDVDRVASQILNPDRWYDHNANPGQNKDYNVGKPDSKEIRKQYLIAGIQMTMPGSPMIYYGDEAGMWGGDDPDCRKPMLWPELSYETETADPLGRPRKPDIVKFDQELYDWYKKLIHIRNTNESLTSDDLVFCLIDNDKKLLGYSRTSGDESCYIIINNKAAKDVIDVNIGGTKNEFLNLIDDKKIECKNGSCTISLPGYGIAILR